MGTNTGKAIPQPNASIKIVANKASTVYFVFIGIFLLDSLRKNASYPTF
jgi:hypothetical protein